jgi:methylenetetrahydrofolate--tRNA-(uracil-5-)-methyltransferase
MNINFGLFPPLAQAPDYDRKSPLGRSTAKALAKKSAITRRALADLQTWMDGQPAREAAE